MVVSDSCTLILLTKASLLSLYIKNLTEKICIPPMVYSEVTKGKQTEDAKIVAAFVQQKEILVKTVKDIKRSEKLCQDFSIGIGGAEAICLCMEQKAILITDDRKAIQLCKLFELQFTTALNILVALYKKGKIKQQEALSMLDQLATHGRYTQALLIQAKGELQ